MNETQFSFSAADGTPIAGYRWQGDHTRAVVQIAHGMGEHAGRYRRFAACLVAAGYAVYANDHRGHGRTAVGPQALGDFGPQGFAALANDMAALTRRVRLEHAGCPVILFGHSMGSFAAQLYLLDHSSLLGGLILSGSAALDLRIAARNRMKGGFPGLNAQFEPSRTPFDWLSRDTREVDAYVADPMCGFTLVPASAASMSESSARLADIALLKAVSADLPMYLLTGDSDPVNDNLRWFFPLMERYRQAGLVDVSCHVYGGARHEMLNETNRDEVTTHLIAWLDRVTA
jgi:alpha-beta hydrolase superfamily lysophospholipase